MPRRPGRREPYSRAGLLNGHGWRAWLLACLIVTASLPLSAAVYPSPVEGDYVIEGFRFSSGESLPELRIHYRTLGKPVRGRDGRVHNAVLVTRGHGSHTIAMLWKQYLQKLLQESE